MTNKKGFTLIELLIVVAIIGLLATLAIISLTSAQAKARDTKRVADLKSMQNALELYNANSGGYPEMGATDTWADFGAALEDEINSIPQPPGTGSSPDIYVYGSDAAGTVYCIYANLERSGNQMELQDEDVANCGSTTTLDRFIDSADSSLTSVDCATGDAICLSS